MKERALYIHIPWCIKKCPYCDFNSHRLPDEAPFKRYIDALIADLSQQLSFFPYLQQSPIASVFIGGGTPSLCPPEEIQRLLHYVKDNLACIDDLEVTIEANPGTAESKYFKEYVLAGVNRISIGAQSFDNDVLMRLGRIHSKDENYRAVEWAYEAGFKRINIDLMYALPEQSLAMAKRDLTEALACNTEHLSYYQLTLEENTSFYRQPPHGLPDEKLDGDIYQQGMDMLGSSGFSSYEVSAWSRDISGACRHNVNYWKFGDYIGIGAGAHGKLSRRKDENMSILRTQHSNSPLAYMQGIERLSEGAGMLVGERHKYANGLAVTEVSKDEILFEYMLNRLRLTESFGVIECCDMTGLEERYIENALREPVAKGFVVKLDEKYQKTALGHDFLNDLIWEFH